MRFNPQRFHLVIRDAPAQFIPATLEHRFDLQPFVRFRSFDKFHQDVNGTENARIVRRQEAG
jgi:hypothetical protein